MITDDWVGMYKTGWKNLIVKDAFSHPAKYSRSLIANIYKHALEEGWIENGGIVLDPFGGVGLGALDAMRNGLVWVGCELESRFQQLGNENIALWNKRYSGFPHWGKGYLLQGDSKHLIDVIQKADLNVSSPPYADSIKPNGDGIDWSKIKGEENRENTRTNGRGAIADGYSQNGENLGNMKDNPDSFEVAISSPPFLQQSGGTNVTAKTGPLSDPALIARHSAGNQAANAYGNDPANLGNMPEGDLILSSPPYADIAQSGGTKGLIEHGTGLTQGERCFTEYGNNPAQLGKMQSTEENYSLALSSPPYSETRISGNGDEGTTGLRNADGTFVRGTDGWEKRKELGARYGNSDGNLGNLKDAGLSVSSPPFSEPNNQPCIGQGVRKDLEAIGKNPTARYGGTEGNLGNMDIGVSSPPFENSLCGGNGNSGIDFEKIHGSRWAKAEETYGKEKGNIGNDTGNDFWSAARIIVEQVYTILKPGAHSIWITKRYVKDHKIVDFTQQWIMLCEAVGFQAIHHHKAWLVENKGTQIDLFGEEHKKEVKRYSFFRRLHAAKYPELEIQYEDVICMQKPE